MPRTPLLTDDVLLLVSTAREQATGWASQVCQRRDSALLLQLADGTEVESGTIATIERVR